MAFPKDAKAAAIAAGTRMGTGTPPPRTEEPLTREERGLYQSELEAKAPQQAPGVAKGAAVADAAMAEANRRAVPDKRGAPPAVIPGQRAPAPTGVTTHDPFGVA